MHKTECIKKPLPANGAASVIDTKDQYGYTVKVLPYIHKQFLFKT